MYIILNKKLSKTKQNYIMLANSYSLTPSQSFITNIEVSVKLTFAKLPNITILSRDELNNKYAADSLINIAIVINDNANNANNKFVIFVACEWTKRHPTYYNITQADYKHLHMRKYFGPQNYNAMLIYISRFAPNKAAKKYATHNNIKLIYNIHQDECKTQLINAINNAIHNANNAIHNANNANNSKNYKTCNNWKKHRKAHIVCIVCIMWLIMCGVGCVVCGEYN